MKHTDTAVEVLSWSHLPLEAWLTGYQPTWSEWIMYLLLLQALWRYELVDRFTESVREVSL